MNLLDWAHSESIKKQGWVVTFQASSNNWHVNILYKGVWHSIYWTGSHEVTNHLIFEDALKVMLKRYTLEYHYEEPENTDDGLPWHQWNISKWVEEKSDYSILGQAESRHQYFGSVFALAEAYKEMLEREAKHASLE